MLKRATTKESKQFWENFDRSVQDCTDGPVPFIGEAWWEAENELSPELLGKSLEDMEH